MIATNSCGYLSGRKRATLSATYTPTSDGFYTVEFYNYRSAVPTCINNYIDDFYLEPAVQDLTTNTYTLSCAAGGLAKITIDAGAAHGGEPYFLLASFGCQPGFNADGFHVPLNRDPLFNFSMATANSMMFQKSKGVLGSTGVAVSWFSTMGAVNPIHLGKEIYFSYVLLSGSGIRPITYVSIPIMMTFTP